MKSLCLYLLLFLLSPSLFAYIPKLRTILSNTAEKRLDTPLKMETELVFQFQNEKLLIKEEWYLQEDGNIFIRAKGPGFAQVILHRGGKRYRPDDKGKILSSEEDTHFFMPLFLSKDPNVLSSFLKKMNLVPAETLQSSKRIYKIEDIEYSPEANIRLTRLDGMIAYGIGTPTPVDSKELLPQLWIEQDSFLLRKLRGNNYSVEASDYKEFSRGAWYPQRMKIRLGEVEADLSTLKVFKISIGKNTKKLFEFDTLKEESNRSQLGSADIYKELEAFYLKYR